MLTYFPAGNREMRLRASLLTLAWCWLACSVSGKDVVIDFKDGSLLGWSDPHHAEWKIENDALVATFPTPPNGIFDPWIQMPNLSLLVDPKVHRYAEFEVEIVNPGHDDPMAFGVIWLPHMATFYADPNKGRQTIGVDLENGSVPWTWSKEFQGRIRLDPCNQNDGYADFAEAEIRFHRIVFTDRVPKGIEPIGEVETPPGQGMLSIDAARDSFVYDR